MSGHYIQEKCVSEWVCPGPPRPHGLRHLASFGSICLARARRCIGVGVGFGAYAEILHPWWGRSRRQVHLSLTHTNTHTPTCLHTSLHGFLSIRDPSQHSDVTRHSLSLPRCASMHASSSPDISNNLNVTLPLTTSSPLKKIIIHVISCLRYLFDFTFQLYDFQ